MDWVDGIIDKASEEGKRVFKKHKDVLLTAGKTEFTRVFGGYYSGELTTFDSGIEALHRLAGTLEQENKDREALIQAVKEIGLTLGLFALSLI